MRILRCSMVKDDQGRVLKVLYRPEACANWIGKHFPGGNSGLKIMKYWSSAEVCREFDAQMQVGTTDIDVIMSMLWYGGVSKTRDIDGSGHFIGTDLARVEMNRRKKRKKK